MKKMLAFSSALVMMSACVSLPAQASLVGGMTGIDYSVHPELAGTVIIIAKDCDTSKHNGYVSYLAINTYLYGEHDEHISEGLNTWDISDDSYAVGDILASDKGWVVFETYPGLLFPGSDATITKVATCDELSISTEQIASNLIEFHSSWVPGISAKIEQYCNKDFVLDEDILQYVNENNLTYDDYKRIAAEGLDNPNLAKASDIVLGDVDGDGETSVLDVISVNRYILGKADFSASQTKSADVDKSGIVDSADALLMMKKVVGIVEEF